MGVNKLQVVMLFGLLSVIFFIDFTSGRGILRKGRSGKSKIEKLPVHVRKYELLQRQRSRLVNTERRLCSGTDCNTKPTSSARRHRHRHGYSNTKKKSADSRDRTAFETKKRVLSFLRARHKMAADDSSVLATDDYSNRASYDQYGAGFGRPFPRLQRPPAADRFERRLRPSIRASAQQLLSSMDRVIQAIRRHQEQLHFSYDFVFNSTRYVMMNGVRESLKEIAKVNDDVLDAVLDSYLLTKQIYLRAHQQGLTGPTTENLDRPHFPSLRVQLAEAIEEERHATKVEGEMFYLEMECKRVDSRRQQVAEYLSRYADKIVIFDLMRYVNRTARILSYFDNSVVFQRIARYKGVEQLQDVIITAHTQVRVAKENLRAAANNFRGNRLVYVDWKTHKEGSHGIAPVSYTDARNRYRSRTGQQATDVDIATRNRIRNNVRQHISHLQSIVRDVEKIFPPLIKTAERVIREGVKGSSGLAVFDVKLQDYIQKINVALDKLRMIVGDESELRQRCEELEMGSGDSGESPIDCDIILEEGSGFTVDKNKTVVSTPDTDFEFVGEIVVDKKNVSSTERLTEQIKTYTQQLLAKCQSTDSKAKNIAQLVKDQKNKLDNIKNNINAAENFITVAKNFTSGYGPHLTKAESMDSRVRTMADKVRTLSNVTRIRTAAAVLKAEKKLEEIKGGGKSGSQGAGVNNGQGRATITQAIESSTKAKNNMASIVSLRRETPITCGNIKQRVHEIRSNISDLRQKVAKARMVLSNLQVAISKTEAGYISIPMKSDESSKSLETSVELCIKPKTLDGVILILLGNDSQSHVLSVYNGKVVSTVYDKQGYEKHTITSENKVAVDIWYSVFVKRLGYMMSLSLTSQDAELSDKLETWSDDIKPMEPPLASIYLGGAPDTVLTSMGVTDEGWQGCVGGLRVNGQSLGLLQKGSDGKTPKPCNTSCSYPSATQAMIFEGNGFLLFPTTVLQFTPVRILFFEFHTHQANTFLMSIHVEQQRFLSEVRLEGGSIVIEMPTSGIRLRSQHNIYNNGVFHKLKITYSSRTPLVDVDGGEKFTVERTRPHSVQNKVDGIHVGGKPSASSSQDRNNERWLMGCIRNLKLNSNLLQMSDVETLRGVYLGKCNSSSIWRECVAFVEGSETVSFEDEADGKTVLLSVSKHGLGPLLNYKKEKKFNIEIEVTNGSIDVTESVKDNKGSLTIPETLPDHFISIAVKDSGSAVTVSAMDQSVDFSYGSGRGFWGVLAGGNNDDDKLPHTITVAGIEDDTSRQFYGGISQLMIGKRYIDLHEYISSNKLQSCTRKTESMATSSKARIVIPC